ncbi:MAG: ATP-binding protein [bacterium]
MSRSADSRKTRRPFLAPHDAEKDLTFRTTILRSLTTSMHAAGILGITIPIIYTLMHLLLADNRLSLRYDQIAPQTVIVIWDKLLIVTLGVVSLLLARISWGARWGRLTIAVMLIVSSQAIIVDDIAGADISLTVGWLALMMFVSAMIPFRAWQTLAISTTILGLYILSVEYLPALTGWQSVSSSLETLVFLVLFALATCGIGCLLYGSRFHQHLARRQLAVTNRKLRDTQAQLVQSAKMASIGSLVAGIAHEINTPLGAIHSNAHLASRSLENACRALESGFVPDEEVATGDLQRSIQLLSNMNTVTLEATHRIDSVIRALRNFARLDEAERKPVDLHEGIESSLTILPMPTEKNIHVVRDFQELPSVNCYPGQFNQILMNVLLNSVEAIEREGTITVSTRQEENWAVIRIADTGQGMRPEELQQAFDPGYTTKGVGVGTGLGLSICYRIMENHSGKIDLSSTPQTGTAVTLRMPIE